MVKLHEELRQSLLFRCNSWCLVALLEYLVIKMLPYKNTFLFQKLLILVTRPLFLFFSLYSNSLSLPHCFYDDFQHFQLLFSDPYSQNSSKTKTQLNHHSVKRNTWSVFSCGNTAQTQPFNVPCTLYPTESHGQHHTVGVRTWPRRLISNEFVSVASASRHPVPGKEEKAAYQLKYKRTKDRDSKLFLM